MKTSFYGSRSTIGASIPNGFLNSSIINNKYNNVKNLIIGTSTTSAHDCFGNQYNLSSNTVDQDQDRFKFISPANKNDYLGSMNNIINNVTYGRANISTNKQITRNYDSTSNSNNKQTNESTASSSNVPNDKINMSKPNESPYYAPSTLHKQDSSIINHAKLIQNNYPSSSFNSTSIIKSYASNNEGGYKSTNYTSSSINGNLINLTGSISNSQNKK